jgi:uncharacterized protein (TIGR02145 family)
VSADRKQDLTGENQKTGVFYNWYAATAGTGTWDITTQGAEAQSSVCPAGWELPRYSNVSATDLSPSGSWLGLIRDTYHVIVNLGNQTTVPDGNVNANNILHDFPFSLPYSGDVWWEMGTIEAQGGASAFWTAGAKTQTKSQTLAFGGGTNVWNSYNGDIRLNGFSVRCVAKTFWSISEMQQMTQKIAASATTPSTSAPAADTTGEHQGDNTYVPQRTLTDIRGSVFTEGGVQKTEQVKYTVRKLADGKVWMTDNLSLNWSSTRDFTSADTNVKNTKQVDVATQSLDGSNPAAGSTEAEAWKNAGVDSWLSRSSNKAVNSIGHKYGTYYNWYTAIMKSIPSTTTETYPITAEEDICPAGWQLPRYSDFGSYLYLFREAYHVITDGEIEIESTGIGNSTQQFPLDFVFTGRISNTNGVREYLGGDTRVWGNTKMYSWGSLAIINTSNAIYPRRAEVDTNGISVRCIAK